MKEHPVTFSKIMIPPLMLGIKHQTRRVVPLHPGVSHDDVQFDPAETKAPPDWKAINQYGKPNAQQVGDGHRCETCKHFMADDPKAACLPVMCDPLWQ